MSALAPGATLGILGGGQLGRMLGLAAARLGLRVVVFDPDGSAPAAQVANDHIAASYEDTVALSRFADAADVVTFEWENIPVATLRRLAERVPLYPPPGALDVAQDRVSEKRFLNGVGVPTPAFYEVDTDADLAVALRETGGEGVLKTRRLGYDGKGQRVLRTGDAIEGVVGGMGGVPLVLEALVPFACEISVIAARGRDGAVASFDPPLNRHRAGILHTSTVPAGLPAATLERARDHTARVMDALNYVGVIGVEFFVLPDNTLLANEIAPRVHNSGHWTEAACAVSQFEQHVRAVCGLPLGSPARHSDCVMTNLIGDEAHEAFALLARPDAVLHLYGKREARPGRKMGHWTRLIARD